MSFGCRVLHLHAVFYRPSRLTIQPLIRKGQPTPTTIDEDTRKSLRTIPPLEAWGVSTFCSFCDDTSRLSKVFNGVGIRKCDVLILCPRWYTTQDPDGAVMYSRTAVESRFHGTTVLYPVPIMIIISYRPPTSAVVALDITCPTGLKIWSPAPFRVRPGPHTHADH